MQPGQAEWIAPVAEQFGDGRPVALGVALENLGRRDRHRRVEENLHRRRQLIALAPLTQDVEQLLGAFEREGRNDDVAAALECRGDGLIKLLDRWRERLVQTIAVGRLHDDGVDLRRIGRRAQQRSAGVAEVAGEQGASLAPALLDFEQNARRAENMPSVEEGDHDARRERNRPFISGDTAEEVAGVERVQRA